MTNEEIKIWSDYHTSRFPMFRRQFGPAPKDLKGNPKKPDRVREFAYMRMLRDLAPFTLEEAKSASDIISKWEKEPPANRHVDEVIRLMKNRKPVVQRFDDDNRPVYNCRWCHDSGYAPFYSGSMPGYREKISQMYDNDSWKWLQVTTDCFCVASKAVNSKLQEHVESLVSGWIHRCEMTPHQIECIEKGVQLEMKWQTTSKEMEF